MYPIYFLRHGEPNSKYGLTDNGINQAEKLTKKLDSELKNFPEVVIKTSPAQRSELTGRIIQLNLEHKIKSFQVDYNHHIKHFVRNDRKRYFEKMIKSLIKKSVNNPVISMSHEEIIFEFIHSIEPEKYNNRYQNVSKFAQGYKFYPDSKKIEVFSI